MIEIEPVRGWVGRAVQCGHITLTHYEIAAGAPDVHEHHHPQEEAWSVVDGQLSIWVDGEERTLGPGEAAVVPPNVRHPVRALARAGAIVVDSPRRDPLPGTSHRRYR
jgi:quercetin dioxygenase-like cupin family protein